ncbi:MAG: glycoside hydrolase family 3 N-terminal domain-containing protein, partial [Microbacterium sp.]
MSERSLERLANGVLWPGFLGRGTPSWVAREREAGLAGVVLFAQNLGGEAVDASDGFLVGIDEEGGTVTRVDSDAGSDELGAAQLGALDDEAATAAVAGRLARRAAETGANVVIAPVADVNTNPRNPVIGTRSFGSDPAVVARHVAAAVRGLHAAGAVAVPKHFPGHGDTAVDSHHGLPTSGASEREQRDAHLLPFAAAVESGARAIMTAHLVVPAWGDDPATANPRALAELRELGFDGVIASDALDMAAMRARFGAGAPVRALAAGCDLLCVGNPANPGSSGDAESDFLAARGAIVDAVRAGRLPGVRLEEAAERVGALRAFPVERAAHGVGASPPLDEDEAWRLARRAARLDGVCAARPGARTVVDARAAATWAVSSTGSRYAEMLARGGAVVEAASLAERELPARSVVLVDRLADPDQREAIALVARRDPAVVVVNLGVDPAEDMPVPAVHVRAASRLAVAAADAL